MVKKYANPWNLTDRQAAAMDAMVQHGCAKRAADALGISIKTIKTIEAHNAEASLKMGRAPRLVKYLQWDRWRRGAAQASGESGNG